MIMASRVQDVPSFEQNAWESNRLSRENILKKLPLIAVQTDTLTKFVTKLRKYEDEQEVFKQKLQRLHAISQDRLSLENEMCKKNNKMTALQKALSHLQKTLLLEQEDKQKLKHEVELLKLKEKESAKKIQCLLHMTKDKKLEDDIVYIFDEPLGIHVRQRVLPSQRQDNEQTAVKGVYEEDSTHTLLNQQAQQNMLEALKAQNETIEAMVNKQSELTKSRIDTIIADCNITMKEAELMNKYDREKIQLLANKLQQAEKNLISVNSELLDVRKDLHREEILREMQKDVLLKHFIDSISHVSLNDTVENIIAHMARIINNASKLFESIENNDLPANFNISQQDSENAINVEIYPSQVNSETRSKSLEHPSNKGNKPLENASSRLQHTDSMGQFIHHHHPSCKQSSPHRTARCVSFSSVSPNHKEILERTESAPLLGTHQPRSCLKMRDLASEKNTAYKSAERASLPKSGLCLVRPKTADPRRRQPPQNAILRSHSANQKNDSHVSKKHDVPSDVYLNSDHGAEKITDTSKLAHPKNSSLDTLSKELFFVPFPKQKPSKQCPKRACKFPIGAKPKSNRVVQTTENTTQCDLSDEEVVHYQRDYPTERAPRPYGLFTPRIERNVHTSAKLPRTSTQSHHGTEFLSSVFEDSASETKVKTHDMHPSSQIGVSGLFPPRYCDERIDNLKDYVKSMHLELQEIHNRFSHDQSVLQNYEDRCALLENVLSFQKNEFEALSDQQKKEKESLAEKLNTTKSRLSKLERYRRLEVEGFRTDIRMLTQKVRDMEKQLYKSMLIYEAGGKDEEFLRSMHTTTKKSMNVSNEMLRLKAKLYQLESALKQL